MMKRRRASRGEVSIQQRTNGAGTVYLYLWIPSQLCEDGKGQRYSLGLKNSVANYAIADLVRRQVQIDIDRGCFLWDKAKYLEPASPQRKLAPALPTHQVIWDKYCQAQKYRVKANTLSVWEAIANLLKSAPKDPEALLIHLQKITTVYRTEHVFRWLGTAYRWAIKKGLVTKNPLTRVDVPAPNKDSEANPLSREEKIKVLEIAKNTEWDYFVQFLFLTGCRPSEAVGLTWEQIAPDSIKFDRSITLVNGKPTPSPKSKTNRIRYFPINENLATLVENCPRRSHLVFGDGDRSIHYLRFAYWWRTRINPWKTSTPYSCRDTFITEQILSGVPPVVVAQWCDNSVTQIERRYLKVLPREFLPK